MNKAYFIVTSNKNNTAQIRKDDFGLMFFTFRLPFIRSKQDTSISKTYKSLKKRENTKKLHCKLKIPSFFIFLFGIVIGAIMLFVGGFDYSRITVPTNVNKESKKTVYLTFDDGPSKNTSHLLAILKKYNIKATFFVIGPVDDTKKNYPELLKAIVTEGHTIAPHTYSHDYSKIYSSCQNFMEDFSQIKNLITDTVSVDSCIYRFPGGSRNRNASVDIVNQVIETLKQQGYVYYDWNIVSGDDTAVVYSPETLYNNVITKIDNFDSPVILFHDASLCTTTADAVDLIIAELLKRGYTFAPLTKDVEPMQFKR